MASIHSLEVTFDEDGSIADWTFNGGRRTGRPEEMDAAREALLANLDFLEMARSASAPVPPKTDVV